MKKPQNVWKEEEEEIMNKVWILFPEEAKKMLGRTDHSISGKANGMKLYKLPSRFRSIIRNRLENDIDEVIANRVKE